MEGFPAHLMPEKYEDVNNYELQNSRWEDKTTYRIPQRDSYIPTTQANKFQRFSSTPSTKISTSTLDQSPNYNHYFSQNQANLRRLKTSFETAEGKYTLTENKVNINKYYTAQGDPSDFEIQLPTKCSYLMPTNTMYHIHKEKSPFAIDQIKPLIMFNCKKFIFIDKLNFTPQEKKSEKIEENSNKLEEDKHNLSPQKKPFIPLRYLPRENVLKTNMEEKTFEIKYTKYPTCHCWAFTANKAVCLPNGEDASYSILIGFNSGDVLIYNQWKSPVVSFHCNKNGCFNKSFVSSVLWVPGSEGKRLVASFIDGSVAFLSTESKDSDVQNFKIPSASTMLRVVKTKDYFAIWKNRKKEFHPQIKWQFCEEAINQIQFSPDGLFLALACADGYLRIVSMEENFSKPLAQSEYQVSSSNPSLNSSQAPLSFTEGKCYAAFQSYFGGFLCVQWSSDGNYILTGGEDDLVTLWDFTNRTIVIRCQSHRSWVSSVAFDYWNCNEDSLRFGSVGFDGRMMIWEYSHDEYYPPPRNSTLKRVCAISPNVKRNKQNRPMQSNENHQNNFSTLIPSLSRSEVRFSLKSFPSHNQY